jgi:hypothetical protein
MMNLKNSKPPPSGIYILLILMERKRIKNRPSEG